MLLSGSQSTATIKKPEASDSGGFFTDIWNFLTNSNNLPRDKNTVSVTNVLESETLKDNLLEERVKNDWYKWASYSGTKKYLVSHQLCKFSHLKR